MSKSTPRRRDPSGITGGGDRYEALLEVLQHRAQQEARDRAHEARERKRPVARRTPYWPIVILGLITAWLWLLPPPFLRTDPPAPAPIQEEEATLRWVMYLQAQRIRAFELAEGRLPDDLEEAGQPLPGMNYVKLAPPLYELTGRTERVALTYRSDLPLIEFVGASASVLDLAREP